VAPCEPSVASADSGPFSSEKNLPGRTVEQAVFQNIAAADVFVLIVGAALGSTARKGHTFLDMEYEAARKAGKPVIIMMLLGRLLAFSARLDARTRGLLESPPRLCYG